MKKIITLIILMISFNLFAGDLETSKQEYDIALKNYEDANNKLEEMQKNGADSYSPIFKKAMSDRDTLWELSNKAYGKYMYYKNQEDKEKK